MERGETVTTGNASYDTFFRELAEVKSEADRLGADLQTAARPLNDAVGQGKEPSHVALRNEAKKLQVGGTLLHLDVVPEAKLVTSGKADASSQKLLDAAEQTVKGSLAVARRADDLLARVADLEKKRGELGGTAGSAFTDSKKRAEVTQELSGAEGVLKGVREAGEKHGGAASKLVLDLAMALETGAGSSATAKKPAKPAGGGGKGGSAGPAKPKGDDFDK